MMRFYRSLGSGVRRLVLFFVVSVVVINAVMAAALIGVPKADLPFGKFGLYYTARYAAVLLPGVHADDDSWEPMHAAAAYFKQPHDKPLYQTVFFGEGQKFQYPPISLLLVNPLLRFPYDEATSNRWLNFVSWLAVAGTALLVTCIFLRSIDRYLGASFAPRRADRLVLTGLAICATLTFFPVIQSFVFGQIQSWLNLLFAAALLSWMSGRKGLAGVLLAVTCMVKPQLALFLVWGALRKEWRFVGSMFVVGASLGVASLVIYGVDTHLDYLSILSFLSRHGESYYLNQSVNGLLNRLLSSAPIVPQEFVAAGPDARWPAYNAVVMLGTLVSTIVILGFALFWRLRERAGADVTDFMIAALSFTIATPVAWTHHYGVTLPIFAVMVPALLARSATDRAGVVWLALAYLLVGNVYEAVIFTAHSPLNILMSYMFFGAVLLLVLLYRLRHAQHREAQAGAAQAPRRPALAG